MQYWRHWSQCISSILQGSSRCRGIEASSSSGAGTDFWTTFNTSVRYKWNSSKWITTVKQESKANCSKFGWQICMRRTKWLGIRSRPASTSGQSASANSSDSSNGTQHIVEPKLRNLTSIEWFTSKRLSSWLSSGFLAIPSNIGASPRSSKTFNSWAENTRGSILSVNGASSPPNHQKLVFFTNGICNRGPWQIWARRSLSAKSAERGRNVPKFILLKRRSARSSLSWSSTAWSVESKKESRSKISWWRKCTIWGVSSSTCKRNAPKRERWGK